MPKFGTVEINDVVLDALGDDKLVVFAGAGVSREAPSNLPSFATLVEEIEKQTQVKRNPSTETEDEYLGRLFRKDKRVHMLAAEILNSIVSRPNTFHFNLLRLFRSADKVRIVTTNFDGHFSKAAVNLKQIGYFESLPKIYRAPLLPDGDAFNGIVHVHGALTEVDKMVLTDIDFARTYIREDWARQFMFDMYQKYVVLFIGYSHSEVVMKYLAKALPGSSKKNRYAIIPSKDQDKWSPLEVQTTTYQKNYEVRVAASKFAEIFSRNLVNWQDLLKRICEQGPELINELAELELDLALKRRDTTNLFTKFARHRDWPKWLADKGYLSALFKLDELRPEEDLLAKWLASNYVIDRSDVLLSLVFNNENKFCLNPAFWYYICIFLGSKGASISPSSALRTWAMGYLSSASEYHNQHFLLNLAEQCAQHEMLDLTVKMFLRMGEYSCKLSYHTRFGTPSDGEKVKVVTFEWLPRSDNWSMSQIWEGYLKPQLASVAQDLVRGVYSQISNYHHEIAWSGKVTSWNFPGGDRLVIEEHLQKPSDSSIDVTVKSMREALEWLLKKRTDEANEWIERMITSDVSLLRRIAIHAIGSHPKKTVDERLEWLSAHTHLLDDHLEIYKALTKTYPHPDATSKARKELLNAVIACKYPDDKEKSLEYAQEATVPHRYDLLEWLSQTIDECPLLQEQLSKIKGKYPNWKPRKLPVSNTLVGEPRVPSAKPDIVEELLSRRPSEQPINKLLNYFKANQFEYYERSNRLESLHDACKQEPAWGIDFAKMLVDSFMQENDLWVAILSGLQDADLQEDDWRELLKLISKPQLQAEYAHAISFLLLSLVRNGGKPYSLNLLDEANKVALSIWRKIEPGFDEKTENIGWVGRAINDPPGVAIESLLNGLWILLRGQTLATVEIPDRYLIWFDEMLKDETVKGGMARCLLAENTNNLWRLNKNWTLKNVIPLLIDPAPLKFIPAWHGFLAERWLAADLADELNLEVLQALERLDELEDQRERFFEFFAVFAAIRKDKPIEALNAMFRHANQNDWTIFARHIGILLQGWEENDRREVWNRWLSKYWTDRWNPSADYPSTPQEAAALLKWLPFLDEGFSEAVSSVVISKIEIGDFGLSFWLEKTKLVDKYPEDTAKLLIRLCLSDSNGNRPDLKFEIRGIALLLPKDLPPKIKFEVNQALLSIGLPDLDHIHLSGPFG